MHKPVYYEVLGRLRDVAGQKFGTKLLYTKAEVAEVLGISERTLYRRAYPFKYGSITLEAVAERLV